MVYQPSLQQKQFISLLGVNSDVSHIQCGVSQGSLLGRFLFIIYVNDISIISPNASLVLFANDTNIFLSGSNYVRLQQTIRNDLAAFSDWLAANKLSLNVDKTNFIVFK